MASNLMDTTAVASRGDDSGKVMAMRRTRRSTTQAGEWLVLAAAFALLGVLVATVVSCGNQDLIFPGMIPATPTAVNTATPTPSS